MKTNIALFFALNLILPSAFAAPIVLKCPEKIETNQSIKATVNGWAAGVNESPHWVNVVRVFDGPPVEMADLVPDDEDSSPTKAVWTFTENQERSYWMSCTYVGTKVTLEKQIPKTAKSCSALYEKARNQWLGLTCK